MVTVCSLSLSRFLVPVLKVVSMRFYIHGITLSNQQNLTWSPKLKWEKVTNWKLPLFLYFIYKNLLNVTTKKSPNSTKFPCSRLLIWTVLCSRRSRVAWRADGRCAFLSELNQPFPNPLVSAYMPH